MQREQRLKPFNDPQTLQQMINWSVLLLTALVLHSPTKPVVDVIDGGILFSSVIFTNFCDGVHVHTFLPILFYFLCRCMRMRMRCSCAALCMRACTYWCLFICCRCRKYKNTKYSVSKYTVESNERENTNGK